MSETERNEHGVKHLPRTLKEAIELAENSELLHDALSTEIMETFIQNKKLEWEEFCQTVTDYERKKYLSL